jgi:hypothetical protein
MLSRVWGSVPRGSDVRALMGQYVRWPTQTYTTELNKYLKLGEDSEW